MRTKIKAKYSAVLLIVALLALAVGLLLFGGGSATSASAATAPKYTVVLNGTYTQGTVGGASTATIENQTEISTVVSLGNKRETASLSLESTAVSGTAILQNKDYIGFSGVRFIASQSKYSLTIYNEYNSVVASGKGVLYADLTDGLYKVVMSYSLSSGAGYTQFAMGFNLYCYFTVDSKAPTISGATLSQTGALKNTPFTVTATDSASGVNTLYMKAPNSNTYVSVGTSKTILENNINGLYCFYAKDNVGNTSATYYTVALGHNFSITVLEPTCTEGGHTTYSCKRCDYEYIADYTPANGHNYEETVVEATCTERGYKLHKCSACDDEYKTDETFALGHYYTERTQEVTCTQNGCILHTCTRCGCEYETNVTKALGHKYVSEVTMPATCTDDGNRHYLCARCGDQYDTAIPAFGHNYEITDVKTDGGVTVRTYSCSICGHSYTQDLGDQYEEVSNYVEYLFRQYAPYMWWVFLAVAGVWSIAMGVAIVVANKNEDKQKAKKMLVNYVIGLVVIAVILITCPYLVRGIAALIAG